MYWRTINGKPYLFRSVRLGDRVHKEYLGSGPAAVQAAQDAAQKTVRNLAALQRADELRTGLSSVLDQIHEIKGYLRGLMAAMQWQRGYYQHCRAWRLRGDRIKK